MEHRFSVSVVFAIVGVAVGLFVLNLVQTIMVAGSYQDPLLLDLGSVLSLKASVLLALVSAVVAFFALMRHERASTFVDSVVGELLAVTWPSRDETSNNTGIVVGASLFFALLLGFYDLTWAKLTEFFLYNAG